MGGDNEIVHNNSWGKRFHALTRKAFLLPFIALTTETSSVQNTNYVLNPTQKRRFPSRIPQTHDGDGGGGRRCEPA